MTIEERRRGSLERIAVLAGEGWTASWFEELRREGRRIVGGWPGTLTEARARVAARVAVELPEPLDKVELEALSRKAYSAAKAMWLSRSEREEEP